MQTGPPPDDVPEPVVPPVVPDEPPDVEVLDALPVVLEVVSVDPAELVEPVELEANPELDDELAVMVTEVVPEVVDPELVDGRPEVDPIVEDEVVVAPVVLEIVPDVFVLPEEVVVPELLLVVVPSQLQDPKTPLGWQICDPDCPLEQVQATLCPAVQGMADDEHAESAKIPTPNSQV